MTGISEKFSRRSRSLLRMALVFGMVTLLAVQLGWWLIFFEMNQEAAATLERRVGLLEESIANREAVPYDLLSGMPRRNGRYIVDPKRAADRETRHRRQLAMLLAETLFVLSVIGYGSYRVIRSLQREIALNHERNIFLDSVSHELKTPIAGVRLALQTLLRREYSAEQRREVLGGALRDADRLEEQVANLLTAAGLARMDRGEKAPTGVCNLTAQAAEVVAQVSREIAAGRNLSSPSTPRLECKDDQAQVIVPVRPELIETVLRNLLRNALSYAPGSDRITVSVDSVGRMAVLRVADRGPGIPPEERKRVFEPLYRIAGGANPHRGTGMGLYIVAEIVRKAGGSARALEREGGGTVLEVRLPKSDMSSEAGAREGTFDGE